MSACRDCGVDVRFARVEGETYSIPLDPAPDEDGGVIAKYDPIQMRWVARFVPKDYDMPPGWQLYMHHHQSCAVQINLAAERALKAREQARLNPPLPGIAGATPTDPAVVGPRTTEGPTR